jgi:hypothetical protein
LKREFNGLPKILQPTIIRIKCMHLKTMDSREEFAKVVQSYSFVEHFNGPITRLNINYINIALYYEFIEYINK